MSKYGESIGIWELRVGGANLDLKPKKGDNLELMGIVNASKEDESSFFTKMYDFIHKMIARDYPPESPGENEELDIYIEYNLMELVKECMIAFRWAKRDALESITASAVDSVKSRILAKK